MTKKSFLFLLFSLALLAAFTPRTAQATTTTITIGSLSQAPFQFFITEPANDNTTPETTPEDTLNLTITGGTWVTPLTVLVTESGKGDEPKGTASDVLTFFNDASGARVCAQSYPIDPALQPCSVIADHTFNGEDGGGGGGGAMGVPAIVDFQTSAGTVHLAVRACGGPGSCGNANLSDGVFIALAPAATPEPTTLALLGTGILSVGLRMRRRKKAV
jgi:hypothetical protein